MKKRLTAVILLIAYSAILIRVMVFKNLPMIRVGPMRFNFGGTHEGPANLIPFKTILPYLLGENGLLIAVINIAGNIILLVPIGFLVPFIFRNMNWKKSLVLGVASGLTIEGMQEFLHVGIFDIDDVILNGLGVMVGYWISALLAKWVHSGKYKTIIIAATIVIAAGAVTLYAIYPKGHQGVHPGIEAGDVNVDRIDSVKPDGSDSAEVKILSVPDPCNGTGGTGQIVSVTSNTITIKRNDGSNQIIKLTDKTSIRNSAGTLSLSGLKSGNRVTVVVDDSETAAVVLVCNVADTESKK